MSPFAFRQLLKQKGIARRSSIFSIDPWGLFFNLATTYTPAAITPVITTPLTGKTIRAWVFVFLAVRFGHKYFATAIGQVNKRHYVPPKNSAKA